MIFENRLYSIMENIDLIGHSRHFLYECAKEITNISLQEATQDVLIDPRFIKCPAARIQHQAYLGGLIVHTAEVMRTALAMAISPHLAADLQVLIPAIIWHDYGKIYDYDNLTTVISYTDHQSLIRHLARSYAMFMSKMEGKIDDVYLNKIGHCILAHHGRKEWGSPVEPITPEAHILHYSDCLSAFCAKKTYELPNSK